MQPSASVYLIPSFLSADAQASIPAYVLETVHQTQVIFAENERTARRFLKAMDQRFPIDAFEWHTMNPENPGHESSFRQCLRDGKKVSVISEAGCPGVADPGQELVAIAHQMNVPVYPLVGPNSILLALMGSGMNGQQFEFMGYLPIKTEERNRKIREMDLRIQKTGITCIFIETPYRNNALVDCLLQTAAQETRLCIAIDLTGKSQSIQTKPIGAWRKNKPDLPKIPVIFLLGK
jgi:16S rRNA (cytidine1402-2'-O)-methyltransferase